MANDQPYCDRFYETNRISDLPRDFRFDDDVTLSIDYARESEVTSYLREMLRSASERGDNVGTDEFEGERGDWLTEFSFIFSARSHILHPYIHTHTHCDIVL